MRRALLLSLTVLIIPACGGSSDSGFTTAPAASLRPSAIVPENLKVLVGATNVSLDGSKSFDPVAGAPPLTYLWEQTAGPTATLVSATNVATLVFNATGVPATLTFRLTVTGAQGTDSASVTVSVKTFVVTAPDTWFVGYGSAPTTITPIVSGTTAAPTYLWTGFEPWLNVTSSLTSLPLTFTTPTLTEFQNFPDRAGVLLMERTTSGRLQLKIRVTDGSVFDEDYVNVSVGPFADSVANENVALGEPVFLNGGATIPKTAPVTITSWTWVVKRPNDTTVTLRTPNKAALAGTGARFVYFVPDVVGIHKVTLTQNNGTVDETIKTWEITCGKYVGVGNLTGTIPDPFKGECASCHGGQFPWLADFANSWKNTVHAHVLETILDPVDPFYTPSQAKNLWNDFFNFGSEYSIDSRSVGWSRPGATSNGGWADMAATEGCVLRGSSWDDVIRRHPKTAGRSNVQCESCHGPGSEHAGDSNMIRKSYDALVCGRCHSTKQDLWESSGHSLTNSPAFNSGSGSTSCNGCHTAQGFVVEMRAQENAAPHPVLFAVGNVARPVLPVDDRRGTTCQACHEPHKKTVGRPASLGPDPQLRAYGDATFRNGQTAFAGSAAVCYMCHQSRTDTRANSADMNGRRAPHDSTAAEMLSGTNGVQFAGWTYDSSPHANKNRFIVPGQPEARQCLSCHNDVTPSKGQSGYLALGGHSFQMSQGDGSVAASDTTAGTGTVTGGTRTFTFPPSPTVSLLRKIYTGDLLTLVGGSDAGSYFVDSVDGSRQVTVRAAGPFTAFSGTIQPTNWTLTSVPKSNVATCSQCHPAALDFQFAARQDWNGSMAAESVQVKIDGLLATLKAAIEAKLTTVLGAAATLTPASGRIKYTKAGLVRTFPGPSVTASDNPDISWAALSPAEKATWDALYGAAYNWVYVTNDHSEGIHNTGYAVNLLQSSYNAVTGTTIGSPYVPY